MNASSVIMLLPSNENEVAMFAELLKSELSGEKITTEQVSKALVGLVSSIEKAGLNSLNLFGSSQVVRGEIITLLPLVKFSAGGGKTAFKQQFLVRYAANENSIVLLTAYNQDAERIPSVGKTIVCDVYAKSKLYKDKYFTEVIASNIVELF